MTIPISHKRQFLFHPATRHCRTIAKTSLFLACSHSPSLSLSRRMYVILTITGRGVRRMHYYLFLSVSLVHSVDTHARAYAQKTSGYGHEKTRPSSRSSSEIAWEIETMIGRLTYGTIYPRALDDLQISCSNTRTRPFIALSPSGRRRRVVAKRGLL